MPEIVKFQVFCLERYKYEHNMSGKETFMLFKRYGVLNYISSFYDVLHSYGDKYIVSDIGSYIKARQ